MRSGKIKFLIGLIVIFSIVVLSFIFFTTKFFTAASSTEEVKRPDLAGSWYPADAKGLSRMLDGFLGLAKIPHIQGRVIAIISPHAGFAFSGPVAAYGYKLLEGKDIKTVIVLGFSHRKYYDGISVYNAGQFQTPIGNLKVDQELANLLISKSERMRFYPEIFNQENSIETQLPFIKKVLPQASIVPVAFGNPNYNDCKIVADILAEVLTQRDDVVLIASTDMSHYMSYAEANRVDADTIELMRNFEYREIFQKSTGTLQLCCGYTTVTTALMLAERMEADNFKVLKYANSGDTYGRKESVVGYLSAAIYRERPARPDKAKRAGETSNQAVSQHKRRGPEKPDEAPQAEKQGGQAMLNQTQRDRLLQIARETATTYLRDGKRLEVTESDPVLNEEMGVFVTFHNRGQLRGCIGNIVGRGPLYLLVRDMAIETTKDPRFTFKPVTFEELKDIDIEISALSPMEKVDDPEKIEMGRHGVLVRKGFRSGVYLPQVATETGWSREEFLTSLCAQKAGLPPHAWKKGECEIYIFEAEVFGEEE